MSAPRTRSTIPVACDCKRARHEHGTRMMYQRHRCGCDPCTSAHTEYHSDLRPARPDEIHGLFVATFPYHGGLTAQRAQRILRPEVVALAEAQGVELLRGDPVIRVDRTGAGVFIVVSHPAVTSRPAGEVRERAAVMAYEHEMAHPALARCITKHLEEVAA